MFERLTVLAPGLLGASVLRAVKAYGLAKETVAWSRRPETRVKCAAKDWCDVVCDTPEEAVSGADAVILCPPVEHVAPLAERIASHLEAGTFVTDVGSTKSLICRQGQAALAGKARWVGSHPMAGSEKTGLEHADAELFRGRVCFVTPLTDTPESTTKTALEFWQALGMDVKTTTPEEHDEIVAHVSHLPHLLASTLCSFLAGDRENWRNYAGQGLADTTRIAAGDPGLWKEIVRTNREEILRSLQGFGQELQRLERALYNGDDFELKSLLERGKDYRDRLRG